MHGLPNLKCCILLVDLFESFVWNISHSIKNLAGSDRKCTGLPVQYP